MPLNGDKLKRRAIRLVATTFIYRSSSTVGEVADGALVCADTWMSALRTYGCQRSGDWMSSVEAKKLARVEARGASPGSHLPAAPQDGVLFSEAPDGG
jgi:hypothetical protein